VRLADVEKAIGCYEQALVIIREIGDRLGDGTAFGNLGAAYARLGKVEKATALLRQAIEEQTGDPRIIQLATQAHERLSPE
jgi:tetratricopeptide (TPR) repeat protein